MIRYRKLIVNKPILFGLVGVTIVASLLLGYLSSKDSDKTTDKPKDQADNSAVLDQVLGDKRSGQQSSNAQSGNSSTVKLEPPQFTVYYPDSPPSGMKVDKSSVTYSKDHFAFSLNQVGQNRFFVYEQPAEELFSYQRLKVKMGSPTEIDTKLGKALIGTLGVNFITAFNTDKNTLLVINCTALACASPSKVLLESMRINNNPTALRL